MKNQVIKGLLKDFSEGIAAGILISIGGAVFLAMLNVNKYVGAFFFSVALLCICYKGYNLFTGKVGYIVEKHDAQAFITLFTGLVGNFVGTLVCGIAIGYAIPDLYNAAVVLCDGKIAQELWQTLIRALFCGVLMYLAVSIFREHKTVVGILFCIPVFILSGFEHSIADMAYFFTARAFSTEGFLFILMVLIGNALGAMILPAFTLLAKKKPESAEKEEKND